MNIKLRAIELLNNYEDGKYSNIALDEYLKKNKLTSGEKAFLTEVFYGVIRNIIFIDYQIDKRAKKIKKQWLRNLLRISLYQCTYMNSDIKGVLWEGTELAKKKYGIAISKFVNGLMRAYTRGMEEELKKLELEKKYDILYSYPKWFVEKIEKQYKEKAIGLLKSLKKIPYLSYRVNKLKYSEKEFETLLEKNNCKVIKKLESIYYIQGKSLIDSYEFKNGLITIQDASSYLASSSLEAQENEFILDACSAPGGKSLVMAEKMNNTGKIIALDIYEHKIKLINDNANKMGINNIESKLCDATKVSELKYEFDKILVDAPCSGFGVLRKKPEMLYNKSFNNIEELSKLQYLILLECSKKLKLGGTLVYSTCTIFDEENINNLNKFLKKNKNFRVEEMKLPENIEYIKDELGGLTILDPILDGFYIAKLKKVEN